jgi:hypothetical protein
MYRRMWLQIDGTPVHFGRAVRDWCDEVYPEGWMGRGHVACPPRSQDITPVDFFLWGYLKDKVYATPPNNRDDLIQITIAAAADIVQGMLQRIQQNMIRGATACVAANGANFEHLL